MRLTLLIVFLWSGNILAQKKEQLPQMIIDLNPAFINPDFSQYDQKSALFLAQLSELVYWDSLQIEFMYQILKREYPDANFNYRFLQYRNRTYDVQALLWSTKDFLVIAFRGTEPKKLKDWLTDSKFWNYANHPDMNEDFANLPAGHGGFRKSLIHLMTKKNLFQEIDQIIKGNISNKQPSEVPIYLTGHSLGAALSQMFIEPIRFRGLQFAGAYHFAPPLAVSCDLNSYMKSTFGNKVYDIVNYKDYVPRAGRNNVAHFGKYYRICTDSLMYQETEAYVKFKFRELKQEFTLHSLASYILHIRRTENTNSIINERSVGHTPCMELIQAPRPLCY